MWNCVCRLMKEVQALVLPSSRADPPWQGWRAAERQIQLAHSTVMAVEVERMGGLWNQGRAKIY